MRTEMRSADLTRINLDADAWHRVTLMGETDQRWESARAGYDGASGTPSPREILLSAELSAPEGGIWQATTDFPSKVDDLARLLRKPLAMRASRVDPDGSSGSSRTSGTRSRQGHCLARQAAEQLRLPLSPKDKTDLTKGGKLEALQIMDASDGQPVTFHAEPGGRRHHVGAA